MRFRRPGASIWVFVAIVVGVVVWIGSGILTREPPQMPTAEQRPPPTVAASWSEARPVERLLTLYGDIEPEQLVRVRAQTAGQIAEMLTVRGAVVEPGVELARLDLSDREARLRRAEARLASAEYEFDIAGQLVERGTAPEVRLQTARAELEAARAEVETIETEIRHTTLRAPIHGVVNRLLAEVGDFVSVGGEVVEIVDNDPLRAIVQVPQHAIGRIQPDGEARVSIIGREPVPGTIRFIAPLADAATRTFRVEIEVPNPDGSLPSGLSAEVVIPTETVLAHRVSPAIISLDDQGAIGIYGVDEDDTVVFHPIQLVRAEAEGVSVTGIPERARLITIRAAFLSEGQPVQVRETPAGYAPAGGPAPDATGGPVPDPASAVAEH